MVQVDPSKFSAMFQVKIAENHVSDKNRTLIITKMGLFKNIPSCIFWEASELSKDVSDGKKIPILTIWN